MIQRAGQLSQAGHPETVVAGKELLGCGLVGGLPRTALSGFICIEPEGYAADDALASWVQRGLDFVSGLPAELVRASS